MMMQMPIDQQGQQLILQPALIQYAPVQHPAVQQPMQLVRQRPNAVSIRNRRKRENDSRHSLHNNTAVDSSEKNGQQQTPRRSRAQRFSSEFSARAADTQVAEPPQHSASKSEDRNFNRSNQRINREWRRQRAYSDEWDREGDTFSRAKIERQSMGGGILNGKSHQRQISNTTGPMKTLDRRISASTDQLDTLRKKKGGDFDSNESAAQRSRRTGSNSSTRHQRPRSVTRFALDSKKGGNGSNNRSSYLVDNDENDFSYGVDKAARNSYFFSSSRNKSSNSDKKPGSSVVNNKPVGAETPALRKSNLKNSGSGRQKKTAVDIFLEDEGPYSRKLYGPAPPNMSSSDEKTSISDDIRRKKRTKSHEILNEVGDSIHVSKLGTNHGHRIILASMVSYFWTS